MNISREIVRYDIPYLKYSGQCLVGYDWFNRSTCLMKTEAVGILMSFIPVLYFFLKHVFKLVLSLIEYCSAIIKTFTHRMYINLFKTHIFFHMVSFQIQKIKFNY